MAGPIRVAVSGAAGRMGRAAVRAVAREPDLALVGALGRTHAVGEDAGVVAGGAPLGVAITADLAAVLRAGAEVLVDFSPGPAAVEHARAAIPAGVCPVIGGTGITTPQIDELGRLCERHRLGAVVAPNFALGAVLMMVFARQAARYFPHAEVIEMHHDRKRDAPSGTAMKTAALIAQTRGEPPLPAVQEEELAAGARGGRVEGVPVHSVRLPGLVAHQAVIFGGAGQTLTIRHDSINEESFMPGMLLAIRRVRTAGRLIYGLEPLLELG
ncbi:MAG: 4-hydroxy-tetrahydrodipicolinate reductase [Armatimonadota bacterium]|nr:4-hydroxy-tetrahydrodipicolinate reductase [Armatimonadota bacterium]MDR7452786.1 4-hydroxy-tetrahydrodipicolinate reductase [Armatimonadota bacterium]MDR7466565.1 4-hydroxy-tetrahydrodipicolinate reductase [Armatimonadota bacterium]MDR7495113.1 4-hydroxy-tetrahydrodipicolinate reductase [Armatimonadota bacterium]MDR7500187.1 4-hydroxy-tetrahydrodipicolinate reductase [Armatimonadota bacterium]